MPAWQDAKLPPAATTEEAPAWVHPILVWIMRPESSTPSAIHFGIAWQDLEMPATEAKASQEAPAWAHPILVWITLPESSSPNLICFGGRRAGGHLKNAQGTTIWACATFFFGTRVPDSSNILSSTPETLTYKPESQNPILYICKSQSQTHVIPKPSTLTPKL